ncbi:MAG: hypothetical protein RJA52_913, partial [Bacteroidota bacterium]
MCPFKSIIPLVVTLVLMLNCQIAAQTQLTSNGKPVGRIIIDKQDSLTLIAVNLFNRFIEEMSGTPLDVYDFRTINTPGVNEIWLGNFQLKTDSILQEK